MGRTDPRHTKTCQREPEAATKAVFRRPIADLVLGHRHGDTPINRSPIPPRPKPGQLCRLVELVVAAPSKKASSVNIARLACCVCSGRGQSRLGYTEKAERRAQFALGHQNNFTSHRCGLRSVERAAHGPCGRHPLKRPPKFLKDLETRYDNLRSASNMLLVWEVL